MTAQSKPDEQTGEKMRVRLVTPYQLTLGMELLESSSGRSISRMKANRRIAKAPGNPRIVRIVARFDWYRNRNFNF